MELINSMISVAEAIGVSPDDVLTFFVWLMSSFHLLKLIIEVILIALFYFFLEKWLLRLKERRQRRKSHRSP